MSLTNRIVSCVLCMTAALGLLAGCAGTGGGIKPPEKVSTLQDFEGAAVASNTGSVFDQFVDAAVKNVQHQYYNDLAGQTEAVASGKADAAALDQPVARLLVERRPELAIFPEVVADDSYGYGFRKGDPLAAKASEVIERFAKDGTSDEIAARWFSADEAGKVLPRLDYRADFNGSGGVLRFGYDPVVEPMMYSGEGGQVIGYDVELMQRIAYELNMTLEMVPVSQGARVEAVVSGTADVVAGCMSITEERRKSIDFSTPYYIGGIVLVVKASRLADDGGPVDWSRYAGKKIGVATGSAHIVPLEQTMPDAIPQYFDTYVPMIEALQQHKIEGFMTDEPVARHLAANAKGLKVLPELLTADSYAFALTKGNDELYGKINDAMITLTEQGVLKELDAKWFSGDEGKMVLPEIDLPGPNGTLRMAVHAEVVPFVYWSGDKIVGYETEIALRVCEILGYKLEFKDMKFAAIIPSLLAGDTDFAGSCIVVTEERKKSVMFTEPTYYGGCAMVVLNEAAQEQGGGWWQSFKDGFVGTFITEQRYKMILNGLGVTLLITLGSAVLGTLLGFGVCMMRRSPRRVLQAPARAYIRLLQGVPMVVVLMILAYIVFRSSGLDSVLIAIIGFSLNFAAYTSEMMRTGVDAIDKGQLEAAAALGLGRWRVFQKIIFPQAAMHVLPVYRGEFISMLKMTSVVGYIAIQDLTKASDIIRSRTFDAFFSLLSTALIYFLLSWGFSALLGVLEKAIDPKRRKRVVKGVDGND